MTSTEILEHADRCKNSGSRCLGCGTEQNLGFFFLAGVAMEIHDMDGVVTMAESVVQFVCFVTVFAIR